MVCERLQTKKYKSRPGPPYHAKHCKGQTKKGNDGKEYVSKANKAGVYVWQLKESGAQTRKVKRGTKVYTTTDNGGHPFRVEDDGSQVIVFRQTFNDETENYEVGKEVYRVKYKRLYVGEDPYKFSPVWEPWMRGNSILLHLGGLKYVFIGHAVLEFEIDKEDEEIVKYISYMGNSGVPYPYAIGKKHTYIIPLDKGSNQKIDNSILDLKDDVWGQYIQWTIRPPTEEWKKMSPPERTAIEKAMKKYKVKTIVRRVV
jgi:hypothetical protein